MAYEYRMVQLSPVISVHGKERGTEAAGFLQGVVDQEAREGWEFYRVDTIGVLSKTGCLGALFGVKETAVEYYVATFRKSV